MCLSHSRSHYLYYPQKYSASSSLAGTGSGFASAEGEVASQIRQQIENLKGRVSETGMELDRCKQEQEGFSVEYYTFRESQTKVESMQQQVHYYFFYI